MARNFIVCSVLLSFFVIIGTISQSFAADDSQIKATDQIKKNPAMMEMLKKIELSKKILAEMQEKKTHTDKNALRMQEIRSTVKASLDQEISRMSKDYEQFNSQNAFAKFVAKKPSTVQPIYQSMFDYQQEKTKAAKAERDRILSIGGKFQDAWSAYQKMSATNRIKLIQMNKDLNIKFASSDITIQSTFDEKGKLPRTSD